MAVYKSYQSSMRYSVRLVKQISSKVRVLCGAGIVDKNDIEKALELGSEGILISSGVVKAPSWYNKILELSSVLK
jgi:triosephosphate isomerase